MWKRAPRKEMDAIMTEEEKVNALLGSVEEGVDGRFLCLEIHATSF